MEPNKSNMGVFKKRFSQAWKGNATPTKMGVDEIPSHPLSNVAIEKWVVGTLNALTCGDFVLPGWLTQSCSCARNSGMPIAGIVDVHLRICEVNMENADVGVSKGISDRHPVVRSSFFWACHTTYPETCVLNHGWDIHDPNGLFDHRTTRRFYWGTSLLLAGIFQQTMFDYQKRTQSACDKIMIYI